MNSYLTFVGVSALIGMVGKRHNVETFTTLLFWGTLIAVIAAVA